MADRKNPRGDPSRNPDQGNPNNPRNADNKRKLSNTTKQFAEMLNGGSRMTGYANGAQPNGRPTTNMLQASNFGRVNEQHALVQNGANHKTSTVANGTSTVANVQLPKAHCRSESFVALSSRSENSASFSNKDDDVVVENNPADIRGEVGGKNNLKWTREKGGWFEASWSGSYESKHHLVLSSKPNFMTPFITTWLDNINEDVKATFLKNSGDANDFHRHHDVDTMTGNLMPPVVQPDTMRSPEVLPRGPAFRQENWTANIICSKEQDKFMNKRNQQHGDPTHDPFGVRDADPLMPTLEESNLDRSIVRDMLNFHMTRLAKQKAEQEKIAAQKAKEAADAKRAAEIKAAQEAVNSALHIAREKARAKEAAAQAAADQAAAAKAEADKAAAEQARIEAQLKRGGTPMVIQSDGAADNTILPNDDSESLADKYPQAQKKKKTAAEVAAALRWGNGPTYREHMMMRKAEAKENKKWQEAQAQKAAEELQKAEDLKLAEEIQKAEDLRMAQEMQEAEDDKLEQQQVLDRMYQPAEFVPSHVQASKAATGIDNQSPALPFPHSRGRNSKPAASAEIITTGQTQAHIKATEKPALVPYLRPAVAADLKEISLIYQDVALDSAQTTDSDWLPVEKWEKIFEVHEKGHHLPFIVAVDRSKPQQPVVGFALYWVQDQGLNPDPQELSRRLPLGRHSPKIYLFVAVAYRRRKVGTALMDRMLVYSNEPRYVSKGGYEWGGQITINEQIYAPRLYRRLTVEYFKPNFKPTKKQREPPINSEWRNKFLTELFPFTFVSEQDMAVHSDRNSPGKIGSRGWLDRMTFEFECTADKHLIEDRVWDR